MEKVAIIRCSSYEQKEVDKAIENALRFLEFDTKKYKRILIKPNLLGGYDKNQEAITTHPNVVRAIIKQFSGRKIIGESSFANTGEVLKKSGFGDFKNFVIFEKSKLKKIRDEKAKILREFYVSSVLDEVDLVVNVPKLKTHALTKITGAIKNLYGCIPGAIKQDFHRKAIGDERFSSLLVDIYQNIKPGLNIMDGIVGMEGEGPSAGEAKKVGFILASRNAVALDIAAAKMIGFRPEDIFVIREAIERGLYPDFNIKIVGELEEIPNFNFKKPSIFRTSFLKSAVASLIPKNKITLRKEKCTKCRICEKNCPMKIIDLKPYPEINTKKCIRCFCCIEGCPQHALYLKQNFIRKIIEKIRGD